MAGDSPSHGGARVASGVAGLLIAAVAAGFVARTLLRDRDEIGDALRDASLGWVLVGGLLAALGMIAIAVPWRRALRLLGSDLPMRQVVPRYFVGEIGKYVPGGVWPVVGRGELARRRGVARPAAYGSVALSLAALYLAAMFVVLLGLPALVAGDDGTGPIAVLLLLPLGIAGLHPTVLAAAVRLAERVTRRSFDVTPPSWGSAVGLVAQYVPSWLLIGAATCAVARSLEPDAGVAAVGTAAVLSWVIGFVLVPVPGGIGVREAAFIAAAGSLEPGIAAATAVLARGLFVAVDAVGALAGAAVLRRTRRST